MDKNCNLEITGKVAIITINRPPLNTLSRETLFEIGDYLDDLENTSSIRAIMITGEGDENFSAGADVKEFTEFGQPDAARSTLERIHQLFNRIEAFQKPVIACVNGRAYGGGNELQMACHLVIASDTAEFALPEIKLGIMPGYGGTQRLPRLIGRRRAMEWILTGAKISAQTALEYGFINRIVEKDRLKEEALAFATQLAEGPPLAIKSALDSVIRSTDLSFEEGIELELQHMMTITRSEDAVEGISAFFTKRKPDFAGK